MNNKMIKLLAVVGGLLLMSPLAFAGSEPNPGDAREDLRPVINRVSLTLAPSSVTCGGTGVGCAYGDLMIVGKCKGVIISAMVSGVDLSLLGLTTPNDITDITEEDLEGKLLDIGDLLAAQNPNLDQNKCPVSMRAYRIRKVQNFLNDDGVISAVIRLAPQD
jgi:hypothetical protein